MGILLDPNLQKTHYVLDTRRRKRALTQALPFCQLLHEQPAHTAHRYRLYETVWAHQRQAIEAILSTSHTAFFAHLLQWVHEPPAQKLDVAFLALSSNTANNLRILNDFSAYVDGAAHHVRLVRLNSKVCFNIKAALKEVVKQIVQGPAAAPKEEPDHLDTEPDPQEKPESESDNDDDDDDALAGADGGRISYDFEIVQDWVDAYTRKFQCEDSLRIVVVLDDTDGFANDVLNQVVQLFCVYATSCPIKVVMGLSSRDVGDWISSNITSNLRTLFTGVKLTAKDNNDIGFQIVNEILLQNEITAEKPLLLDATLSLIILNRFETSDNSIDSLITELKLAYMIHFYQLCLACFVDPLFQPAPFHYAALRKLPSFKRHIEFLLHKASESGPDLREQEKSNIASLLSDDALLQTLFNDAKAQFQTYQNCVMNAVHIIHWLCQGEKEKFQIYKLVTNNQLVNSAFLSKILKAVKDFTEAQTQDLMAFIQNAPIRPNIGECRDPDVVSLAKNIPAMGLLEALTTYLHQNLHLNMKISDNLFNEVLTINGGVDEMDQLRPPFNIEENFENLMLNLIRPSTRAVLEVGLDEPQTYLRAPHILEEAGQTGSGSRLFGPVLSKLYLVYKDAPVNINLWDFYTAFKQSLSRTEILLELQKHEHESNAAKTIVEKAAASEEEWDKLVYGWFIQSCFEMTLMGFLREKSKGDYMEKMIWKNL